MTSGDNTLERQIRAVLAAEASTRRVVAVRTQASGTRLLQGALRLGSTVPLLLVVVVVAVAAGLGLADWRAQRAIPDGSQVAAAGVPGPLALADGRPSLGFGLVSNATGSLLVRNEITERAPIVIQGALPQMAVSPNGRDIAYWLVLPDRFSAGPVYQLHHADILVAGSTICCGGLLMRAPDGEVPGPLVWSSDGTGLIANTHTQPRRGGPGGTQATRWRWFTIDVASAKATELAPAFAGMVNEVYAWDRQRDLITGSGFDAGQLAFTRLQGGAITSSAIPPGSTLAAADIYGRSLVIAHPGGCRFVGQSDPRCAVLESRDQATFTTVASSPVGEATAALPEVTFRPRSQDLIVQLSMPNGDARVELWSDLGRGPHQVIATYTQNARFTGPRELVLPRVDGSAVFLMKFDDSAGGRWFGELVSLAPNSSAQGGQDVNRTAFEILTGGNPLASVVLDPAFARAMERAAASPSPTVPVAGVPPVGDASARARCDGKLGNARLVGAFESTAGVVADWVENVSYPDAPRVASSAWRALPPSAPAYVCYFDGQFAPPGGPVGTSVPPLVGRALILFDSSGVPLGPSKYGPVDSLPLARPGGRF